MKKYCTLTSSHLKLMALFTMAIDHFGDVFFVSGTSAYIVCRIIGRLAFPLFCFLLVEGFKHTKSRPKYFLRLFAFAFISEIPFNLAFDKSVINSGSLNVFFTLTLGFLAMWALEEVKELYLSIPAAVFCMLAAELLSTDYGWYGVAVILIFYLLRERKGLAFFAFILLTVGHSLADFWYTYAAIANGGGMTVMGLLKANGYGIVDIPVRFCRQLFACFAVLPILLYNGEKGFLKGKYLFYIFYPAHLLVYYVLWLFFV